MDGVLDLEVVEDQVARLVGVADPDEVERHAGLGRLLSRLHQVVAFGRDAVGEHDDAGQGRAAELLQHRADGSAEGTARTGRLQTADGFGRGPAIGPPN